MIVTLDGQRLNVSFPANCTLEKLIEQIRAKHNECLIVSVALNGQRLDDKTLQATLAQSVPDSAQVDLASGDPVQLVGDALRGLGLEFVAGGDRLAGIAERLQSTEAAAAVQDISEFIGLWNTCHRVLVQCSGLLNQDLAQQSYEGRTVQAWFEEAVSRLSGLRDALENRDLVLLADMLRYELPPVCNTWQQLLNRVADQLAVPTPALT